MAPPPPVVCRPVLVLAVLVAAGAAWWFFSRGAGRHDSGDAVARSAPGDEEVLPPIRLDPVLRGAPDATAEDQDGAEAETKGTDHGTWRITFDVVTQDGVPTPWERAELRGRDGRVLQWVQALQGSTTGFLDVVGQGRVAVRADGSVPWASGWLARPVSGALHLRVQLDRGLAVAGQVFERDGRTPLAEGTVRARGAGGLDPRHPSIGFVQAEVFEGRFRIEGLRPGKVDIRARGFNVRQGRPVEAEVQAGDENVRLVLGAGGEFRFLIVDERTGLAPVTGYVRIERVDDDGIRPWLTTSTTIPAVGEEARVIGPFRATPGVRQRFRVRARGYEPSGIVEVVVPETGGLVTARVELRPAPRSVAVVRLRLVAEGAPIPKHVLVMRHDEGGRTGHGYPVEHGVVSLALGPGENRLSVGGANLPAGKGPYWLEVDVHLELAPGEEREVDVTLRQGGWVFLPGEVGSRASTVRWLRGADTRETRIRWHVRGEESGEESGYLLGLLPPGRWTFGYDEGEKMRTGEVDVIAGKIVRLDPATLRLAGAASD